MAFPLLQREKIRCKIYRLTVDESNKGSVPGWRYSLISLATVRLNRTSSERVGSSVDTWKTRVSAMRISMSQIRDDHRMAVKEE